MFRGLRIRIDMVPSEVAYPSVARFLLIHGQRICCAIPSENGQFEEYKMRSRTLFCAMAVAMAFAGNAEAIYKCTTANGVVYQDRPCREGSEADVRIVIPTGEATAKSIAVQDEGTRAADAATGGNFGTSKAGRAPGSESASANAPGNRKSASAANAGADRKAATAAAASAADDSQRKEARSPAENPTTPMTAEQARKTESSARYYTIDGIWPAAEIPEQMNCESPSGEKRRFLLSNGKLSSI